MPEEMTFGQFLGRQRESKLATTDLGPCFRAYIQNYIGSQGKVVRERRLNYLQRPTHKHVRNMLHAWQEQFQNWLDQTGLCPVDLSHIKHGLGYMVLNRVVPISGGSGEREDYSLLFQARVDSTILFDKKIKITNEKGEIMESELKPKQLEMLLARKGNIDNTCAGRFYRVRIQNYFGQRQAICQRIVLHPLKKESCPGCPHCAWIDELDLVHSGVESLIELDGLQHGQKVFLSPVFGVTEEGKHELVAIQCLPALDE